jgi:putative DNA primase/helicase
VRRTAGTREWTLTKSKDDTDGASHPFTLEQVTIARDFMDEAVTSAVVRSIDAPVERGPRPPTAKNQRIVYDALQPLLKASTDFGKAGAPPTRPCLEVESTINQVKGRIPAEPKRQPARVREALSGMVAAGVIGLNEGWLWLN